MSQRAFHPFWLGGLLTLSGAAAGQVEEWVARYTGPVNAATALAMAIDADGFIYVTGWSRGVGTGYDYATIKYDSDGNEVWVARYDGPAHWDDIALAVAVDAQGNVYVTGSSYGLGTGEDFATVKYDADGNELWVSRYDAAGRADAGQDIGVDAQGFVYVTGFSDGGGATQDYATLKYDADGNLLWVARYSSGIAPGGAASRIGLDKDGNVYVTGGMEFGPPRYDDIVTLKYDADGNELWRAFYNGPRSGNDGPHALRVDSDGNVYVTGEAMADPDTLFTDCVTIKYDTEGNELWVALYDGPSHHNDVGVDLAVDAEGNVYVTGASDGLDYFPDYLTLKYDRDGNQVWLALYDGPANRFDAANAVALDSETNVYVTGLSYGVDTGADYATIKYDSDGNEIWVARYDGPPHGNDVGKAIGTDLKGNVYVTGSSPNFGTLDYATIKYSPKSSEPSPRRLGFFSR